MHFTQTSLLCLAGSLAVSVAATATAAAQDDATSMQTRPVPAGSGGLPGASSMQSLPEGSYQVVQHIQRSSSSPKDDLVYFLRRAMPLEVVEGDTLRKVYPKRGSIGRVSSSDDNAGVSNSDESDDSGTSSDESDSDSSSSSDSSSTPKFFSSYDTSAASVTRIAPLTAAVVSLAGAAYLAL